MQWAFYFIINYMQNYNIEKTFFSLLNRMDKANFLNETYIRENGIEEDKESKNMSKARKVVKSLGLEYDPMEYITAVRNKIPNSRFDNCRFLPGITRMVAQNDSLEDRNKCAIINNALRILCAAHANEYDSNLNDLTADQFIKRFATLVQQDVEQKQDKIAKQTYTKNDDYTIVKISDFETASQYANYTSWCITTSDEMYNEYTHAKTGVFYFILKKGFENTPKEKGENCPLDEYGLSMIAVSINDNGGLNTVTCRWNHDNGGNDNIMTDEQLSDLIGENIYSVCKPKNVKITFEDDEFQVIVADEDAVLYDKISHFYQPFSDGIGVIYKPQGETYIDKNGKFICNEWFSECRNFSNGFGVVRKDHEFNYVNEKGKILSKEWFDNCDNFTDVGGAIVYKNGKRNVIRPNGELLLPFWIK